MNDPSTDAEHPPDLDQGAAMARFGIVLLLLLVTFVFLASAPTGAWVPLVAAVLQGATLLAALKASNVGPRLWRFALVIVAAALIVALGVWFADLDDGDGVLFILNALLVGAAPIVIARSLIRRGVVDIHTVMGALCIYVLLGMLWAFAFGAIGAFMSEPFFAQQGHANVADFLYFSYVTQTTVGYGDLTAAEGLGRAVAVLEALLGQLYLVTVVAVVVGAHGADTASDRGPGPRRPGT